MEAVVVWLLPEEVIADTRVGRSGSVWAVSSPFPPKVLGLKAKGQVGVIGADGIPPFVYHTETGDALDGGHETLSFSPTWLSLYGLTDPWENLYLRHQNLPQEFPPVEDGLPNLRAVIETGWVLDREGRHKFWVPAEWRRSWNINNWHPDIMTLFASVDGRPVIIKF